MQPEQIGTMVRRARQKRGLTQKVLGQLAGISKGRIEAIESGRCMDMKLSTVTAVLDALDLSLKIGAAPLMEGP